MISTKTGFGSDTDIISQKQDRIGKWKSTIRSSLSHSAARVLLKTANLSFVHDMYVMTDAYGSLRFSASLLLTLVPKFRNRTRFGSN